MGSKEFNQKWEIDCLKYIFILSKKMKYPEKLILKVSSTWQSIDIFNVSQSMEEERLPQGINMDYFIFCLWSTIIRHVKLNIVWSNVGSFKFAGYMTFSKSIQESKFISLQ